MRAGLTMRRLALTAALALMTACAQTGLTQAERDYADFADAAGALDTIDSGVVQTVAGRSRAHWADQYAQSRARLQRALATAPSTSTTEDERSLASMQAYLAYRDESAVNADPTCANAANADDADDAELSAALYACFDSIGAALSFENQTYARISVLQMLEQIEPAERRRGLFLALSPLWRAVNGDNSADSPYRRLIAAQADDMRASIADAERTLGLGDGASEAWLVSALEAWAQAHVGAPVEPWDFRYSYAQAARDVERCASVDSVRGANERFFGDLGASIAALNVIEDVGVREGISPVDFTDFVTVGRWDNGAWRPALLRVSVVLEQGGLGASAELAHEYGHVAHAAAMRTRAPLLWPDDTTTTVEAIADITAWSVYTPVWQRRFLGCAASQADNLRARLGPVILDIAWGLFELRMARDARQDPNAVWTEITQEYLHIAPHPDLSWWAVRGQLVEAPGYMINYALGAFITADLRSRIAARIGDFDAGNSLWYAETSAQLFAQGGERPPRDLLNIYLDRDVSPDALIADIRALGAAD